MLKAILNVGRSSAKDKNDSPRAEGELPLHAAMRNREAKEVKKLAERGGEWAVTSVDKQGRNAFHVAGEVGDETALPILVKAAGAKCGAALIAKDRMGCTPLYLACVSGSKKVVREFIRNGADPKATNMIGETLLHAVFRAAFMTKSHVSAVSELLAHKVIPLNALNEDGLTALQLACHKGAYDIGVLLLKAGADAAIVKSGDPPLFGAVINENPSLVRCLLEHGADISQPNSRGQTLIEILNPKSEIYRIVKKHAIARPGGARKLQLLSERVIVATSLADLPPELLKIVTQSSVTGAEIERNWHAFCGIIHLVAKVVIVASAEEAAVAREKHRHKKASKHTGTDDTALKEIDLLSCKMLTPGDPRKVFKKMRVAGQGGFGMVFQGTAPDKRNWAIKRMPHTSEKEKLANLRESEFLRRCEHENICAFKTVYECVQEHEMYLIMELLDGGTLDESVGNRAKHRFEEKHLAFAAREITKGLQYLHGEGIIHRDLKSPNVMFTITGEIKIIDFGTAVSIEDPSVVHQEMVGSPYWMPPEMILRKPHGPPADIWSMAVCLLELANHRPPDNTSVLRHMFRVATGIRPGLDDPDRWSTLMRDFLDYCMQFDPLNRPRAAVLAQHKWLSGAATQMEMAKLLKSIFMVRAYDETM